MKKTNTYFIRSYLSNAPPFMSVIRTQEAMLFTQNSRYIKRPVVDFGCGDGFFTQTVFGKRIIDVGLDLINNPRIERAVKNKVYKKILLYDGKIIPLKTGSIQTVISNCVLEHISDIESTVAEIYRILKPGGFFVGSVMTSQWSENLFGKRIFGKLYSSYMNKLQKHYSLLSATQWSNLFRNKNFTIVKKNGYLNKKSSEALDIWHYLSIPSLITYHFFNKWVVFPKLLKIMKIEDMVKKSLSGKDKLTAALFFVLQK
ncbi:MAG: class I SAM-dependent methyltransferase [Patescibacteria group bacterium]